MSYLIVQILTCLIFALLLGLLLGLIVGHVLWSTAETTESAPADLRSGPGDLAALELERDAARTDADDARARVSEAQAKADAAEAEVARLKAEMDTMEQASGGVEDPTRAALQLKHDVLVQRLQEADQAVEDWKRKCNELRDSLAAREEALPKTVPKPKTPSATSVGKPDNLKKIEGIGPKIEKLLRNNEVYSFQQLSEASVADLRSYVMQGGKHMKSHDPTAWPQQAKLAAEGRWDDLEALQKALKAGR